MTTRKPQQAYFCEEDVEYEYDTYDAYGDYADDFGLNCGGGGGGGGRGGAGRNNTSAKMKKRQDKRGGSNSSGTIYSSKHLRAYESLREKRAAASSKRP